MDKILDILSKAQYDTEKFNKLKNYLTHLESNSNINLSEIDIMSDTFFSRPAGQIAQKVVQQNPAVNTLNFYNVFNNICDFIKPKLQQLGLREPVTINDLNQTVFPKLLEYSKNQISENNPLKFFDDEELSIFDEYFNDNGGNSTLPYFFSLDEKQQDEIYQFLQTLLSEVPLIYNDKQILLTHASRTKLPNNYPIQELGIPITLEELRNAYNLSQKEPYKTDRCSEWWNSIWARLSDGSAQNRWSETKDNFLLITGHTDDKDNGFTNHINDYNCLVIDGGCSKGGGLTVITLDGNNITAMRLPSKGTKDGKEKNVTPPPFTTEQIQEIQTAIQNAPALKLDSQFDKNLQTVIRNLSDKKGNFTNIDNYKNRLFKTIFNLISAPVLTKHQQQLYDQLFDLLSKEEISNNIASKLAERLADSNSYEYKFCGWLNKLDKVKKLPNKLEQLRKSLQNRQNIKSTSSENQPKSEDQIIQEMIAQMLVYKEINYSDAETKGNETIPSQKYKNNAGKKLSNNPADVTINEENTIVGEILAEDLNDPNSWR